MGGGGGDRWICKPIQSCVTCARVTLTRCATTRFRPSRLYLVIGLQGQAVAPTHEFATGVVTVLRSFERHG